MNELEIKKIDALRKELGLEGSSMTRVQKGAQGITKPSRFYRGKRT
jgi:hypothetical protein